MRLSEKKLYSGKADNSSADCCCVHHQCTVRKDALGIFFSNRANFGEMLRNIPHLTDFTVNGDLSRDCRQMTRPRDCN